MPYLLTARTTIPRDGGHVFAFFSAAANLDRLTPPWLHVRLETPPRMSVGRATASGHRAVLKHEASCREDEWGRNGENNEDREGSHRHDMPWRHASDQCQVCAVSGDEIDVVPTVEANGNKPISPLSVAAEPHCVSVKNCSWGGGES